MAVQRAHQSPYRDEGLILVAPSHMHANILATSRMDYGEESTVIRTWNVSDLPLISWTPG
jgi:hypothetical protein